VSYDIHQHRASEIEHDVRLVTEGGPGWDQYVRDKVARLQKADPGLHPDLRDAVEHAIAERNGRKL
jgi:hypothetical protein